MEFNNKNYLCNSLTQSCVKFRTVTWHFRIITGFTFIKQAFLVPSQGLILHPFLTKLLLKVLHNIISFFWAYTMH